jgi:ABC-type enterochelin transport system substrate-binding protein
MKKYTLFLAVAAVLALTACGSGSTTNEKKDSTTTSVDTSKAVKTSVDSTAAGSKTEEPAK